MARGLLLFYHLLMGVREAKQQDGAGILQVRG